MKYMESSLAFCLPKFTPPGARDFLLPLTAYDVIGSIGMFPSLSALSDLQFSNENFISFDVISRPEAFSNFRPKN